jgi:hypothetical protein
MAGKHWVIVLIILGSCYGIHTGIRDLRQSQKEKEKWTDADKKVLIENCIRDSKDMAVKYLTLPEIIVTVQMIKFCQGLRRQNMLKLLVNQLKNKTYSSASFSRLFE